MRLEITRRAELAVRALDVVGRSGSAIKGPALAEALGTTSGFVPQVMAPLVKAGWVASSPGPTGGYAATGGLGSISVLDVIEAVDGPTENGRCVVADSECDVEHPCVLHEAWGLARAQLVDTLSTVSVSSVHSPRRA